MWGWMLLEKNDSLRCDAVNQWCFICGLRVLYLASYLSDWLKDRWIDRQRGRQTNKQADQPTNQMTDGWMDGQTNQPSNHLTLWGRVYPEELSGHQLVKKFPTFYGI